MSEIRGEEELKKRGQKRAKVGGYK